MKTTPNEKPAAKAKTPTKAAQIEALTSALTARDATIAGQAARIHELEQILALRQKSAAMAEEEALAERNVLAALMNAIKPVEVATHSWTWPDDDNLAIIQKLTFGQLKAVVSAFKQAQSR